MSAYGALCNAIDRHRTVQPAGIGLQAADAMGGLLVVCAGMGQAEAEFGLATTIGGGAFLGMEARAVRIKEAMRSGSCDFMVNTLDESLRVLKNEVRKRKPVSVGLLGSSTELLQTMAERGVLPDMLVAEVPGADEAADAERSAAVKALVEMGSLLIKLGDAGDSDHGLKLTRWSAEPGGWADLKRVDALALTEELDAMRRRWLERAPGAFRRQPVVERFAMMTGAEFEALSVKVRTEAEMGRLSGRVLLEQEDKAFSIEPVVIARAAGQG